MMNNFEIPITTLLINSSAIVLYLTNFAVITVIVMAIVAVIGVLIDFIYAGYKATQMEKHMDDFE